MTRIKQTVLLLSLALVFSGLLFWIYKKLNSNHQAQPSQFNDQPKEMNQQHKEKTQDKEMNIINLPSPAKTSQTSLEKAIHSRRSEREFSGQALTHQQISQLLWAAQGVTDKEGGRRSIPSAGGLYPLAVYLVVSERGVEDLAAGVYRYRPLVNQLERVRTGDLRPKLAEAALGQSSVSQAPVSIIITAVYQKTTQRYGERGQRYVDIEVGHAGQNLYLQVESLALATVAVGAFDDQSVKQLLSLDEEQPLYIMPVGYPKE